MQKIVKGIVNFRNDVFRAQREMFERLASRQQDPQALFITCSDSRINPNLLTQTEPGDLFILRNAGNIIPPYGAAAGGEGATIEYAVSVLGIKHIIVCGHSHCGAMKALLTRGDKDDDLPAVKAWFSHAEATRRIIQSTYGHLTPQAQYERAIEQNVLVQLDNLRTHPSVAVGLSRGDLHLYGWVYIIEAGEVRAYDPARRCFTLIGEEQEQPTPMPPPALLQEPAYVG
jgi:carbonic anhydrase